ncbi:MAG: response regulator [Chloroflexi bacterium]|nr:response regulator [Chloroflexota bacterium]MDA8188021.1 response regulator [Dehalococcoidales bacterium]
MAKRIAVIDDDRDFVKLVTIVLEREGYEVLPALGSLRAYDIVKQGRPNLIMLDIMMPGRSGWELLDIFKMDPETQGIPLIISTGVRAATARLAGTKYDVLKKPFNNEDLIAMVRRMIGEP